MLTSVEFDKEMTTLTEANKEELAESDMEKISSIEISGVEKVSEVEIFDPEEIIFNIDKVCFTNYEAIEQLW
ncbi:5791_t:CDS:1, partial [Dentiscutata erythropus]